MADHHAISNRSHLNRPVDWASAAASEHITDQFLGGPQFGKDRFAVPDELPSASRFFWQYRDLTKYRDTFAHTLESGCSWRRDPQTWATNVATNKQSLMRCRRR